MNCNVIFRAAEVAARCHEFDCRKYGLKQAYIIHPIRVAGRLMIKKTYLLSKMSETRFVAMVSAAYLHDVIEDTDATYEDLVEEFGEEIADLVQEMTNVSKTSGANREERKKMDRERIKNISKEGKILKLVDRIDNLEDMSQAPIDFVKLYTEESELLLKEALQGTDRYFEMQYEKTLNKLKEMIK